MLVVDAAGGFFIGDAGQFAQRSFEFCHGWNNSGGTWKSGTDQRSDCPPTPPGNVDPKIGACRVFIPAASPMKGMGKDIDGDGKREDIGANVLYAYQDGALTSSPLWLKNATSPATR